MPTHHGRNGSHCCYVSRGTETTEGSAGARVHAPDPNDLEAPSTALEARARLENTLEKNP